MAHWSQDEGKLPDTHIFKHLPQSTTISRIQSGFWFSKSKLQISSKQILHRQRVWWLSKQWDKGDRIDMEQEDWVEKQRSGWFVCLGFSVSFSSGLPTGHCVRRQELWNAARWRQRRTEYIKVQHRLPRSMDGQNNALIQRNDSVLILWDFAATWGLVS